MMKVTKVFPAGTPVVYEDLSLPPKSRRLTYGIVKYQDGPEKAYVWYHSGCTAARTPTIYLTAIKYSQLHDAIHTGCSQCLNGSHQSLHQAIQKNLNREKEINSYE